MTIPPTPPPPDGFADALHRLRRRRRRRHVTIVGTAGGVAAAATAVVLLSGAAGVDSLRVVQPATSPHHHSPTPSSSPGGATRPTPSRTDGSTGPAGGTAGRPTSPLARPPETSTGSVPATVRISDEPQRSTRAYTPTQPCADSSGREASGWCLQPGDTFSGASGHPTGLVAALCRIAPTSSTAHFPSGSEIGLRISSRDAAGTEHELWNLDHQHPVTGSSHAVSVGSNQCLSWTTTWWNRSDTGQDLAPGHYVLQITIRADNVAAPNQVLTEVYDYTVTG